ncbi:MAG: four helix bundle protein [FCB group bacterium]|nr:four helix bundle protein [FCB group bacterium]
MIDDLNASGEVVVEKSFALAVRIILLYKYLTTQKKEFVLSKQLLRSGTSIGANIRESQNAESKADSIHKLAIAQKECDESLCWIELLKETDYLSPAEFDKIHRETGELQKMEPHACVPKRTLAGWPAGSPAGHSRCGAGWRRMRVG